MKRKKIVEKKIGKLLQKDKKMKNKWINQSNEKRDDEIKSFVKSLMPTNFDQICYRPNYDYNYMREEKLECSRFYLHTRKKISPGTLVIKNEKHVYVDNGKGVVYDEDNVKFATVDYKEGILHCEVLRNKDCFVSYEYSN